MTPLALSDFASQPLQVSGSADTTAAPEAIFEELRDPSLWFPMMTRSVWHTAATGGVGAERDVTVRGFGFFRAHMLVWEPGRRVAFTFIETSSRLVSAMGEDWQIEAGRITWNVVATPSGIGRVARPALNVIVRSLFGRGARALDRRARTYPRYSGKQVS